MSHPLKDRLKSIREKSAALAPKITEAQKEAEKHLGVLAGSEASDADLLKTEEYKACEAAKRDLGVLVDEESTLKSSELAILQLLQDAGEVVSEKSDGGDPEDREKTAEIGFDVIRKSIKKSAVEIAKSGAQVFSRDFGTTTAKAAMEILAEAGVPVSKSVLDRSVFGGAIPREHRAPTGLNPKPRGFLDSLRFTPTEFSVIETAVQLPNASTVDVVPEGTRKPQQVMTWQPQSFTTKTLAGFDKQMRQLLEDVDRLQALIEDHITNQLLDLLEVEVLKGDGTARHLVGLFSMVGTSSYAQLSTESEAEAILRAASLSWARGNGDVEAWVSPARWVNIRLAKDLQGQYLQGPVAMVGPTTVFGVPVGRSIALEDDEGVLKPRGEGEVVVRGGLRTYMTDSDGDDFKDNIITVLLEGRFGFVLQRPTTVTILTFEAIV